MVFNNKSNLNTVNIKNINDDELSQNLINMVKQERKLTSQILDYLKEVEDRKLFAKRGYSSLFSYCTDFLGYSESAAQRRISSMRLLKEVPQIKEKITSGELSLSNVSKAASFFRQEQKICQKTYTQQEKIKVLESLNGKTQKEAEIELIKINPRQFQNRSKERVVSEEITELSFTLDQQTMAKLNRLKELKPGLSIQELVSWMLTRSLKQIDPIEKTQRSKKSISKSQLLDKADQSDQSGQSERLEHSEQSGHPLSLRQCEKVQPLRRSLSRRLRNQVWQRDNACCQFKDHHSGKSCLSRVGLEVDHIQPLSLGGDDHIENLRLLCREHHRLMTRQSFS